MRPAFDIYRKEACMSTELEQKVMGLIQANIEKKYTITLDSDLRQDLGVDSFGTIMIINDLEDTFGIEIKESDIKDAAKVADIVQILEAKYLPSAGKL
jgi:acyl carrier protein